MIQRISLRVAIIQLESSLLIFVYKESETWPRLVQIYKVL